jgi:predicted HD superfamily hydrolase involved in NAD metabolism
MEPDREHDGAERFDRPAVRAPGRGLSPDEIRAVVAPRLSARRLAHVEGVAQSIRRIAAGWEGERRLAAERAAWFHDAWKCDTKQDMLAEIEASGEEPDPWALAHAPVLLHAEAGAAWARRTMGESDEEVLEAVRHHPTGHPAWGTIGRALFVADFCEPGRSYATALGTDRIAERAEQGPAALAEAAIEVLGIRLAAMLESGRPIHPDGWRSWNAWVELARP